MNQDKKDFYERIIELIKDDKELHDATIRLINASAAEKEQRTKERVEKRKVRVMGAIVNWFKEVILGFTLDLKIKEAKEHLDTLLIVKSKLQKDEDIRKEFTDYTYLEEHPERKEYHELKFKRIGFYEYACNFCGVRIHGNPADSAFKEHVCKR